MAFSKTYKKSSTWWKHGKHAKLDPRLIANDRKRRPAVMYSSIQELFRDR